MDPPPPRGITPPVNYRLVKFPPGKLPPAEFPPGQIPQPWPRWEFTEGEFGQVVIHRGEGRFTGGELTRGEFSGHHL